MIADRLRAAILQAAISGKLTDQRTEDGTATELLEQIKTERAALVKAKKLQKQKALRPVTEQSQPFAIPTSWEWVRFQDVNQFRIGKTPKRAEPKFWSPSEVPWVSISDMTQGGSIASTKEGVSAAAIAECFGGQPSPAGTLIMSFKLTIGRCSFLGRDAVHNEAIVSIFPAMSAGESFSTYLSHALPLLSQLGDSKAAIKGNTLNSESIANLPIPLPPPMEQERIIAKLDEVLPLIDQLAELERERASRPRVRQSNRTRDPSSRHQRQAHRPTPRRRHRRRTPRNHQNRTPATRKGGQNQKAETTATSGQNGRAL
ncbi:restriction endonuclease subunit S [Corynebacterium lehmanniae]|uniref:restriction endonuclease subunit S n=1 Tax=Corynebacterium haemomassiliense TaxID=2754726 RepID=UPI00370D5865